MLLRTKSLVYFERPPPQVDCTKILIPDEHTTWAAGKIHVYKVFIRIYAIAWDPVDLLMLWQAFGWVIMIKVVEFVELPFFYYYFLGVNRFDERLVINATTRSSLQTI